RTHDLCLRRAAFYRPESCRLTQPAIRPSRLPGPRTVPVTDHLRRLQRLAFVIVVFWRGVVLLAGRVDVLGVKDDTPQQLGAAKPCSLLFRERERRPAACQIRKGLASGNMLVGAVEHELGSPGIAIQCFSQLYGHDCLQTEHRSVLATDLPLHFLEQHILDDTVHCFELLLRLRTTSGVSRLALLELGVLRWLAVADLVRIGRRRPGLFLLHAHDLLPLHATSAARTAAAASSLNV